MQVQPASRSAYARTGRVPHSRPRRAPWAAALAGGPALASELTRWLVPTGGGHSAMHEGSLLALHSGTRRRRRRCAHLSPLLQLPLPVGGSIGGRACTPARPSGSVTAAGHCCVLLSLPSRLASAQALPRTGAWQSIPSHHPCLLCKKRLPQPSVHTPSKGWCSGMGAGAGAARFSIGFSPNWPCASLWPSKGTLGGGDAGSACTGSCL